MTSTERSPLSQPELSRSVVDLARRFVQRWDLHARQLDDGRYICVHEPLHSGLLLAHLQGEITLGAYLLDRDSQARFIVLDADDEDCFSDLVQLSFNLIAEGTTAYLERSRRGGHFWLFFAQAIPGHLAQDFGHGLLAAHDIDNVELFPKQAKLTSGPGSLIRLPFGIHRRTMQRYSFITPDGYPLAPTLRGQIQALSFPKTVPEAIFEAYLSYASPELAKTVLEAPDRPRSTLSERIKQSVTVLEFVSRYLDLKPTGNGAIGLCPFHDDHRPSLGINDLENYWHCFAGCGGGSVVDFWMKWCDCDFKIAVTELAHMLL